MLSLLTILLQFNAAWSRGYELAFDEFYYPLNICIFNKEANLAFYHTCYGETLYKEVYYRYQNCNDKLWLLSNKTLDVFPYDCGESGEYDDYLEYTLYDINIMADYQCDNIYENEKLNNQPFVTNKCLYEPESDQYLCILMLIVKIGQIVFNGLMMNVIN